MLIIGVKDSNLLNLLFFFFYASFGPVKQFQQPAAQFRQPGQLVRVFNTEQRLFT